VGIVFTMGISTRKLAIANKKDIEACKFGIARLAQVLNYLHKPQDRHTHCRQHTNLLNSSENAPLRGKNEHTR